MHLIDSLRRAFRPPAPPQPPLFIQETALRERSHCGLYVIEWRIHGRTQWVATARYRGEEVGTFIGQGSGARARMRCREHWLARVNA